MNNSAGKGDNMSELDKTTHESLTVPVVEFAQKFGKLAMVDSGPGSICGDGGYKAEVETTKGDMLNVEGATSMLGADLSPIAVALAFYRQRGIEYNVVEVTNRGIDAAVEEYGRFDFHTSHHEEHNGLITDCGHVLAMTKQVGDVTYGLTSEDAVTMIETAKQRADVDPTTVIEQNLNRDHAERLVIFNKGEKTTFLHWLSPDEFPNLGEDITEADESGVMVFVIDMNRAKLRHERIWAKMGFEENDFESLHAIWNKQVAATSGGLAKGKHAVEMNWDDPDNPQTNYLGMVQQDGTIN